MMPHLPRISGFASRALCDPRLAVIMIVTLGCTVQVAGQRAENGRSTFAESRRFVGRWQGVIDETHGAFHTEEFVDFEIRLAPSGRLEFIDHDREPMSGGPVPVTQRGDGTIEITWKRIFPNPIKAVAKLSDADRVLVMEILGAEMTGKGTESLRLERNNPHAVAFTVPRLSSDGARELRYVYKQPLKLDDGWPVSTLEREQVQRAPIVKMIDEILAESGDLSSNTTDSVLIARHGKLLLEEYFWGYKRGTAHPISSCTKSLTSILVGIAIDEGKLRTSDFVWQYFQDHNEAPWVTQKYPITIDQMLSMDAGIEWNENAPYSDAKNSTRPLLEAKDPVAFMLAQPLRDVPGTKYNYNSGLPTIMGTLLTRAIGEPIEDFAERKLFAPLGINNYRWARQNDGSILAAGGFLTTPRSMLKIGQLMLNRGMWGNKRIISEDWVRHSTSRHTPADDYAYGYYWHLSTAKQWPLGGHEGFMALGQGGQYIVIVPDLDLVIVITSANWEPGGSRLPFEVIATDIVPAVKM